ncbi:hypothetical protein [Brucella intermedia]|uniref:hypothetical protein n=1 Tax=Brucella intermedia TaxID=94625 RepID=UPI001FE3A3FD|nr:hypothetical protein [Brucella intermedia]
MSYSVHYAALVILVMCAHLRPHWMSEIVARETPKISAISLCIIVPVKDAISKTLSSERMAEGFSEPGME